jgi:replication factor A1
LKTSYGSDYMKISEIQRGNSGVSVEAKVIDISEPREVNTRYGKKQVADATLEDDSGQIALTLWEDQINSITIGDKVSMSGGYVTEFRDKLQLNIPKSGKLEIIEA